jgi:hypothetical protein
MPRYTAFNFLTDALAIATLLFIAFYCLANA